MKALIGAPSEVLRLATYFVLAFSASLVLNPLCRLVAQRFGLVAMPSADRWHRKPTALLGGAAVAVTVIGGTATLTLFNQIPILIAAASLMFVVGLADDILSLKPSTKLVAEVAVASLLLYFGYRLRWSGWPTVDAMLTMLWIIGITNAFNLLDNMDGLCAGISLIAGATLLASLDPEVWGGAEAVYLTLLLAATAGFLVYNVHPASIFLGDSGSLFIGISLAALTLALGEDAAGVRNLLAIVAAPVFVFLVPIFDTTLVTLSRLLYGRRPSMGGRDHSSHRLVAMGLSERAAVRVLWTLAALGSFVGLAARYASPDWSGLFAALFLLAMIIFAVYLIGVRVYHDVDRTLLETGKITPVVVDFMYKRRVAEVILDVCLVSLAYYGAYRLRFEEERWLSYFPKFLESLPLVLGVQIITLWTVGAYRGVWRYFSLIDGVVFAKGVMVGTLAVVSLIAYVYRFQGYSRGVFVIYAALAFLLLTASRASFRLISEFVRRRRQTGTRLIIYGAGDSGDIAVRQLLSRNASPYRMVGFIDDDARRHGGRLMGYPVLGGHDRLAELIKSNQVDEVVVSSPSIGEARVRELRQLCSTHHVALSRIQIDIERLVSD